MTFLGDQTRGTVPLLDVPVGVVGSAVLLESVVRLAVLGEVGLGVGLETEDVVEKVMSGASERRLGLTRRHAYSSLLRSSGRIVRHVDRVIVL